MSTILAVDDSITMRKCLEITFQGTEFNLVTGDSAASALEQVKALSPDLVIADVSLPPNDGYELCSTIKLAAPNIPVLMLASKQNPFDAQKGAQADAHIDKPFDTQVLQDRARELIKSDGASDTDVPASFADRPQAAARNTAVSQSSSHSSAERTAPSSKIPAPRRKRPTPALMTRAGQASANNPGTAGRRRLDPAQAMRRTVPFAMPGSGIRGAQPTTPSATTQPIGTSRARAADTLPGTSSEDVAAAERRRKRETSPAGGMTSSEPPADEAASPAPPPAKPAGPQTVPQGTASAPKAAAGGPAVALPDRAPAALETRLGDLGLTREQMDGVLALSRDLVEQVVWEVVPVLAETLIKEEIRRLTSDG